MVLKLIELFPQMAKKRFHIYCFLLILLVGFSFLDFVKFGDNNFWVWHLNVNGNFFGSIIGFPLMFLIGNYSISRLIPINNIILIRFKNRIRFLKNKYALYIVFFVFFITFLILISSVINILTVNFSYEWTSLNIEMYKNLFNLTPIIEIPLIKQVVLSYINFGFYLLLITNMYLFLEFLFKEKVALVTMIVFIFFQVFLFKMIENLPHIMPISHYGVQNVQFIFQNWIYWIVVNGIFIGLNYFLVTKKKYFD